MVCKTPCVIGKGMVYLKTNMTVGIGGPLVNCTSSLYTIKKRYEHVFPVKQYILVQLLPLY